MSAPTTIDAELREVVDVQQLRRLAEDYAAALDGFDRDALADLFVPDGVLEAQRVGDEAPVFAAHGREEVQAVLDLLAPFVLTQHYVCNQRVAIDGDDASGEVYGIAHHVRPDGDRLEDLAQYIKYLDRYVRTADGWRFARRTLVTRFVKLGETWPRPPARHEADGGTPLRAAEPRWDPGATA